MTDHWVKDILYWEGPLLSLFRSENEELSLHYWIGVENNCNAWAVIPVTAEQLTDYLHGRITLHQLASERALTCVYLLNGDLEEVGNDLRRYVSDLIPRDSFYDAALSP